MTASKPNAAFLRHMARLCRLATANALGDGVVQKFIALADDLEDKATRLERDGGNGAA